MITSKEYETEKVKAKVVFGEYEILMLGHISSNLFWHGTVPMVQFWLHSLLAAIRGNIPVLGVQSGPFAR
jgi:hypothetical protein